jgi:hypothetical protein
MPPSFKPSLLAGVDFSNWNNLSQPQFYHLKFQILLPTSKLTPKEPIQTTSNNKLNLKLKERESNIKEPRVMEPL